MSKEGMTLYEARRNKGATGGGPAMSAPPALRLPVGIAIGAIAVIAALSGGAYLMGHRAGVAEGERRSREASQAPSQTIDPLQNPPVIGGSAPLVVAPPSRATPELGDGPLNGPLNGPLGPPPEGDPQQVGLNYFHLTGEMATDRAAELVAFCRGKGLDVVAIPSHNARSQVIALPGYGRDERGTAPVKALEAKIRSVGAQWKAAGRGNSDFHDYYPKLSKGQQ